jgi:hypothetical protein
MKTLARARDRAAILARLMRLGPDTARRWGRMTAPQMVCHLIDSTCMALGEKRIQSTATLRRRTLVKWVALYGPWRWPPGIESSRELDQCAGAGTPPAAFADDLARLVRLMERFTSRDTQAAWPEHPIFGRLSGRAWLRWGYLHMDHHLRQFGL